MKRAAKRTKFWIVPLVGFFSLFAPFASADKGYADFSIWNRSQLFRNPLGGASNAYETVFHLDAVQDFTNYGTVSLWTDALFSGGRFSLARVSAGWSGFTFGKTALTVNVGDDFYINSNLESQFVDQYHPYFYFRGLNASIAAPEFDLAVFGGKLARLTGLLAGTYELKDQPFYGLRGRWKFSGEALIGAGIVHTRRDPSDLTAAEKNTLVLVDAEVPVVSGLKTLGEFLTSLTSGESGASGSANALRFGPLLRAGKWDFEANYRFTGSRFQDLNPEYQFVRDERGFFSSVQYQATRNLALFGIADRFTNNTDADPDMNTLGSLSLISGFYLNTRSLIDITAQWEFQRRISEEELPGSTDYSSNGVFVQASKTMGEYVPYLRVRLQSSRESADVASRFSSPVVYIGFRKMLPRGSFLWVEGQFDQRKSMSAGIVDRNIYLRTGWNYILSPDFDLYTELFYERYGYSDPASQLVGYLGVRIGLRRDLQLRFDVRASEPLNRRDIRSSDYQFTFRVDKRFSWGLEPKISGRQSVGGSAIGVGGIDGFVFEDRNGDGIMGPGEKGLPGINLRLEDGSKTTTGSDGRYRFPLVAEGPHQLRLEENQIPAIYYLLSPVRVDVMIQPRVTRQVSFLLISGATLSGRFIEDTDRNGNLDPADKGLADVLVVLTPVVGNDPANQQTGAQTGADQAGLILNTYTDADGVFRFVNILPGEYELSVDPETLPARSTTTVPLPYKVKLEPGQTVGGVDFLVTPRPVIRKK
ncbi:MAG: hypothetical protein NTW38_04310 [Candidatus Aminicenantes bacterium]|nr:hypothetical protein [Candidatus Aminicenantes bacterium]